MKQIQIGVRVSEEGKELLDQFAALKRQSLQQVILDALTDAIQREAVDAVGYVNTVWDIVNTKLDLMKLKGPTEEGEAEVRQYAEKLDPAIEKAKKFLSIAEPWLMGLGAELDGIEKLNEIIVKASTQGVNLQILDLKEAAEYLHISSGMMYKLCHYGRIPHFRIGAKILFERNSLDAYIQNQLTRVSS